MAWCKDVAQRILDGTITHDGAKAEKNHQEATFDTVLRRPGAVIPGAPAGTDRAGIRGGGRKEVRRLGIGVLMGRGGQDRQEEEGRIE
eukprot:1319520-Pyramimonas_sp.AAC.1